ncbi:MarR family winged helix-turn-helix transcriptional regulator [Hamadaea tsunoensis]|uniref:MarR family winged helix-turn-helix transcriptional regulator n=1 Tax=Hamadaea tsunoensis TaxID=53368 RepID=UPI001FE10A01|nr:MarR family transcriptional regulator [Hamadaea tsunoensis]
MSGPTAPSDDKATRFSDDERGAWMALSAMLVALPAAIDAQLKRDTGINYFEYSILGALQRAENRAMQMSTLALLAAGSLSRLSHAVTRLENQGWVQRRQQSIGSIRCTEAVLTDTGATMLDSAAAEHVREARRLVFDNLTPDEVRQLETISRRLVLAAAPDTGAALGAAIQNACTQHGTC